MPLRRARAFHEALVETRMDEIAAYKKLSKQK